MDPIEQAPLLSAEEKARAKFLEDFRELMAAPSFRRWLWHVIEEQCGAFFTGVDLNTHATYFALGKREVGMLLQRTAMAEADEHYKRMLAEAINLKTQRQLQERREAQEK